MRGICPNCEKVTEQNSIQRREGVTIRGEVVYVDCSYIKCTECGAEFADPQSSDDPLERAYRDYRTRHGMLQPEEIREFRRRYGLSQKELCSLLGWGAVTLSRYENGALQSDAHERALRLAMEPSNLLGLLEAHPGALDDTRRRDLMDRLRAEIAEWVASRRSAYQQRFGRYQPDRFSGNRSLDVERVENVILYFCSEPGVPKTKLNKELFYADFKHYKSYGSSITGLRYVRLTYGPVPDHYAHYLAFMIEEERCLRVEEHSRDDFSWEVLVAARPPDLGGFSRSELEILELVKRHFTRLTASQISKLSHGESAYLNTREGDLVSYEYASSLTL